MDLTAGQVIADPLCRSTEDQCPCPFQAPHRIGAAASTVLCNHVARGARLNWIIRPPDFDREFPSEQKVQSS